MNLEEIESKIKLIPVDTNSLRNIKACKEFIEQELVSIDELEGGEIIRTILKEHFKIHSDSVKLLIKFHKEVHTDFVEAQQQSHSQKQSQEEYQDEILKEIQEAPKYVTINAAQDFAEGRMFFTFYSRDKPYLVTSSKKLIRYSELEKFKLKLRNTNPPMSLLNAQTVSEYIKGKQVDIKDCLDKVIEHIKQYVILQDKRLYTYLGLWVLGTYMYRAFRYYPYIWINADKGSGKTRLMEVICPLAFNGTLSANQTQATIFRSVDVDGGTLFIDEFERLSDDTQQGILTVLNAGFNIESGKVRRTERQGDEFKVKEFLYYSPKVFAGINEISDVLQDRCVKVRMLKKNKDEHVARYKVNDQVKSSIEILRGNLYVCALSCAGEIKALYDSEVVELPEQLSDREGDIWECIFVISKFIDNKCNTNLEHEMKELAIQGSVERTQDNVIKNVSYKLLNSLVEVTQTIQPVKQENGVGHYNTDDVFNFLREQEDYEFLTSKRTLTTELKTRFQIQSSRLTIKGEKVPVYEISHQYLEDLLERYNIVTKKETNCLAV